MSERRLPLNRATVVALAGVNSMQRVIPAESVKEIERIAAGAASAGQRIQEAEVRCREELGKKTHAAREEGYARGHADALLKLRDFLLAVNARREAVDAELIALAAAAIGRVLRNLPPEIVMKNLIEAALREARGAQGRVVLRVHPDRLEFAQTCVKHPAAANDAMSIVVEPDSQLAPDDCTLETCAGFIDAGLDTQILALNHVLARAVRGRDSR
jgi:flagellar biosynthesis/type III secretory pathway protein FliH